MQPLHPLTEQVLKEMRLDRIQKAIPKGQLEIEALETQLAERRKGLERLQQAVESLQRELGITPPESPQ
jgi:cell division septum initiation protein DivIVA